MTVPTICALAWLGMSCHVLAPQSVQKVTMVELLRDRESWKGKKIEVVGYYVCRLETSALYESERAANEHDFDRSLWVDWWDVEPCRSEQVDWRRGGFVRIVATFDYEVMGTGYAHLWPGKLRAIEVAESIFPPSQAS